jgi:hypothetical protein
MIQGQGFDRFVEAIFIYFWFFDKYPISTKNISSLKWKAHKTKLEKG